MRQPISSCLPIVLSFVMGAIIQYPVAWLIVTSYPHGTDVPSWLPVRAPRFEWPPDVGEADPPYGCYQLRFVSTVFSRTVTIPIAPEIMMTPEARGLTPRDLTKTAFELVEQGVLMTPEINDQVGFPLRALRTRYRLQQDWGQAEYFESCQWYSVNGLDLPSPNIEIVPIPWGWHRLGHYRGGWWRAVAMPLLPDPAPFIANTLIYAFAICTVIQSWWLLRGIVWRRIARRRQSRHQCPACGYNRTGSSGETCPECGQSEGRIA